MTALQDLPEARERQKRWSVDAYERLGELGLIDERSELIRGMIVPKMPKSPLHAFLTNLIAEYFKARLQSGYVVKVQDPIRLSGESEPEPDVAIVRGVTTDFVRVHPATAELIIEVAVSSVALDREKAFLYAEAGIQEYWIVLAEQRKVEVYRDPVDGAYCQELVYSADETLACQSSPELQVILSEWFKDLKETD